MQLPGKGLFNLQLLLTIEFMQVVAGRLKCIEYVSCFHELPHKQSSFKVGSDFKN